MKRLIFASILFATPALAQQKPTPEQYIGNLQVTISDSMAEIKAAMVQRDQQIAGMTEIIKADKTAMDAAQKQTADLTQQVAADKTAAEAAQKTIDDLKAKVAPPAKAD